MNPRKPTMTRENAAVSDWMELANSARSRLAAEVPDVPSIIACFDLYSYAVANLGEAELHARSLDRSKAINVFVDRQPWLSQKVFDLNETGIRQLQSIKAILPKIKKEVSTKKIKKAQIIEIAPLIRETFREKLGEWEMKGSDALKLMDAVDGIVTAVQSNGVAGVLDQIQTSVDSLISVRQEPDRGARDNIPIWKVLTLIGIFAVWILTIFLTAISSGDTAKIIFFIGLVVAIAGFVAVMIFC